MARTPQQKAREFAGTYGMGLRKLSEAYFPPPPQPVHDQQCLAYHNALRQILPRKDAHPAYMKIRRRALTAARRGMRWDAHFAAKRIANPDELATVEGLIFGQSMASEGPVFEQIAVTPNPWR